MKHKYEEVNGKLKLTEDGLRYIKMQNSIFKSSGYCEYAQDDLDRVTELLKDEETLILPRTPEVLSGFILWINTAVEQRGFTKDLIMKKNRNISEYFDPATVQLVTSAFIHSDTRVALLRVKECYAYPEDTLTMVQGHIDCGIEGFDDFMTNNVVDMDNSVESLLNFLSIAANNVQKEISEELKYIDEDGNQNITFIPMYMAIDKNKMDVVYTPYTDSLAAHIGLVFDIEMCDEHLDYLTVNEPEKHKGVEIIEIADLYQHIHELDPWIIEYIATSKNPAFREFYKDSIFDVEENALYEEDEEESSDVEE